MNQEMEPSTTHLKEIRKLLVANRGEIAIRVFRAASELGIRTVAVFTFEDRYSLHRYKADEAYRIGAQEEPLRPYLDIEEIIHVAKVNGVDAIHPGYGFLSENVDFARRCEEEGIIWVGPRPEIMDQLGDKVKAKVLARSAQVPVIEDSQLSLTNEETALSEAHRIGFPIMLKAAAGGGGRGMRVVRKAEDLLSSLKEAQNEALKAFGNPAIFFEKFIENPKHIEVQLLGDNHGHLVHLFERDCSVQRRFQKVVEVAPAPGIKPETRTRLFEYALAIGKKVNYNNAGTVEFLIDQSENIYFIEVNPRIQVEHTITEEVTGIDIVRSQILIAKGHHLEDPCIFIHGQEEVHCNGFAIQCRITTEDPQNNFKPDYGTIIAYRNAGGFGIRLDEGSSYPGVKISPFFDSMLVKVSASGRTLRGSCERLHRTLTEFRIRGVKTNIAFLENVINHPVFQKGQATVGFIDNHPELFQTTRRQDRGTKMLRFLAHTTVNGNPDVKMVDKSKVFRTPVVPAFDKYKPFPKGSKDRLNEMGREHFCQWLREEKPVYYTDTTFRDAHQSLLATRVRTLDMLKVAESFAKNHPQVFSMEVWGGATFDVAMRFLNECPWERLKLLRQAMPNLLLQMLIRSSNAVGYTAYPDNVVELFIEKTWQNGIDVFRIFDSLNWLEAIKVSIRAVRERTGGLAEACICYTGDIEDASRSKFNLQYYLDLARRLEDEGAHILGIKDMAGLLKPYAAEKLVSELKKSLSIPIHLHTHDTAGIQSATYLKAIEAGVDVVDVALASMSGLTSQPNFNSMVYALENHPRGMALDKESLNQFSNYWEAVREFYYPFESELKAGTAEVYEHEIPGGQYSNLRPQARGLGLEDRFETIKKNYAIVNQLFGDVVKVTPSSKVVGDLALFMTANNLTGEDILEKGGEISFPESVKSLFRGELGQPHGGFPEKLQRLVLKGETPFTGRPNEHLQPMDFGKEISEFRAKHGTGLTEEDFLSWKMYPKVFEVFNNHRNEFGSVSAIPSTAFFYGLKNEEEILIEIDSGKTIIVKLMYISEPDENGNRIAYFKLNGQTRNIEVRDLSVKSVKTAHKKATGNGEIGAPLQGRLSAVLVKKDQEVPANAPLFVIEAMKMETTVTAPKAGKIAHIELPEGAMVDQDDLILKLI